jgi:hypothetical protein
MLFSFYGCRASTERASIHIIPRTPRLFLAALCAVHTNDYCTKPCRLLEILFSSGAEISELCIVWPCVFSCRAWQFIFHVRFNAAASVSADFLSNGPFVRPRAHEKRELARSLSLRCTFSAKMRLPRFYLVNGRVSLDRLHPSDFHLSGAGILFPNAPWGHRCAPSHLKFAGTESSAFRCRPAI